MKTSIVKVFVWVFFLIVTVSPVSAMDQTTNFSHIKIGAQNFWSSYLSSFTPAQQTAIKSWQANHIDIATGGTSLLSYNSNTISGGYLDSVHQYHHSLNVVRDIATAKGYDFEDMLWHAFINYRVLAGEAHTNMGRFDAGECNTNGVYVNGVFLLNGSTYTDKTVAAYDTTVSDVTIADKLLIGYSDPFADINFVVATPNATKSVAIEYWNGSAWTALTVTDGTNGLAQSGLVTFIPPGDWAMTVVNGSRSKYWVRYTVTGLGTNPVVSRIYGDDWVATGDGNNNVRGWDATSNTIVGTGDLAYNPTPPVGAQAKFRYQARLTGMWAPNATFGNPSNIQNGERTWATFLGMRANELLIISNGHAMLYDDGNAYPTIVSGPYGTGANFLINYTDLVGDRQTEAIATYAYARSIVKAAYPEVKVGILTMTQDMAFQGDWNMNETFTDASNIYTARWDFNPLSVSGKNYYQNSQYGTSFDGYLPANNPTNTAGIMTFIDTYSAGKTAYDGKWVYWDRGNRSPILSLAAYYMGANENTYFSYNISGTNYNYYGSPGNFHYWSPTTVTLSQDLPANTVSAQYDIYGNFTNFPQTAASFSPWTVIRVGGNLFKSYYKIDNNHLRLYNGVVSTAAPSGSVVQFAVDKNMALDTIPANVEFESWGMYFPAMATDVGTPIETRNTAWKLYNTFGGTGANQNVWKREYTNALMLMIPGSWSTTKAQYDTYLDPIDLGGTYYPLMANGATGAAITSIQLRTGEGAILMKGSIYTASSAPPTTDDTTLPIVSLTAPTYNSAVSGTVSVTSSATDNVGVSKVEFYVNNLLQSTDPAPAPYTFTWNTIAVANGTYTLSAKAYDDAGNIAQSANVSVTVNNPVPDITLPTVTMTSPANNATVIGSITVSATAADNVGVNHVEFYLDGTLRAAVNSAPYSVALDTKAEADGSYTLSAKAYDAAGNVGQSSVILVAVNNAPLPAPVQISGDINGDGKVSIVDVLLAMNISIGKTAPTPEQLARGDVAPVVNRISYPDGKIDSKDVKAILGIVSGKVVLR